MQWATCNLGASSPEEYGDYYGWGLTQPYAEGDNVDWPLYFQKLGGSGASIDDCGQEGDPLRGYAYPNCLTIAGTAYDAAYVKLKGDWRMPTEEEIEELIENTTAEWTNQNGVYGCKVTSKKNGKSIFLPAAGSREGEAVGLAGALGSYWSANPQTYFASEAYSLDFNSSDFDFEQNGRCIGRAIRPVKGALNTTVPEPDPVETAESVDLGLSVKWAKWNLGATHPEEYGDYYGWGLTTPYGRRDNAYWPLYFKMMGGAGYSWDDCGSDRDPLADYVFPTSNDLQGTLHDAAHVKLGGKWRMPTLQELRELKDGTTAKWTTQNGVYGYKLTHKVDTLKYIFLPAAGYRYSHKLDGLGAKGYYWCASPSEKSDYYVSCLYLEEKIFDWYDIFNEVDYRQFRYAGLPIRPVEEK